MDERSRHAAPPSVTDDGRAVRMSAATLLRMRRAVDAHREGRQQDHLAAAAYLAAADAHRLQLEPEAMLVALKQEWAALEDARRLPVVEARDLLAELVTRCIRAYYAPPSESRDDSSGRPATRANDAAGVIAPPAA